MMWASCQLKRHQLHSSSCWALYWVAEEVSSAMFCSREIRLIFHKRHNHGVFSRSMNVKRKLGELFSVSTSWGSVLNSLISHPRYNQDGSTGDLIFSVSPVRMIHLRRSLVHSKTFSCSFRINAALPWSLLWTENRWQRQCFRLWRKCIKYNF